VNGYHCDYGAGKVSDRSRRGLKAAGVNFVLIRDRLEVGGAYIRAVATTRDVDIDSMIVKMVLRY
jgi:hypothetical protein